MQKKSQILILNGSPSGSSGNCQVLIREIQKSLKSKAQSKVLHLAESLKTSRIIKDIQSAEAVIFVTGTYWDSWGSPLQKILEDMTELEGSPALVGKPCAVFVLMHSVGGKGVLSRLQGVLSSMGFLIPPMSGMVYSLVSNLALKNPKNPHVDDLWNFDDIERILSNLILSLSIQVPWIIWPVDGKNFRKKWLKKDSRKL